MLERCIQKKKKKNTALQSGLIPTMIQNQCLVSLIAAMFFWRGLGEKMASSELRKK